MSLNGPVRLRLSISGKPRNYERAQRAFSDDTRRFVFPEIDRPAGDQFNVQSRDPGKQTNRRIGISIGNIKLTLKVLFVLPA